MKNITIIIMTLSISFSNSFAVSYQDTLNEEKRSFEGQEMTYKEALEYKIEQLKNTKMTVCISKGKNQNCGETNAYNFYYGGGIKNNERVKFQVITQDGKKDLFNE